MRPPPGALLNCQPFDLDGYATPADFNVDVAEATDSPGHDLIYVRKGQLNGSVRDDAGNLVAPAPKIHFNGFQSSITVTLDATGNFSVTLAPDTYQVVADTVANYAAPSVITGMVVTAASV